MAVNKFTIDCTSRRVHGKLAMSCTCARVGVAQPIVDLHFCRSIFGYCSNSFAVACNRDMKVLLLQDAVCLKLYYMSIYVDSNIGKNFKFCVLSHKITRRY